MCGIFGVIATSKSTATQKSKVALLKALFSESEIRGKEASGIVVVKDNMLTMYKVPQPSHMLWSTNIDTIVNTDTPNEPFVCIGHTRLSTNGRLDDNSNNQPVHVGGTVGIHNGIIVNSATLWDDNPDLIRRTDVDTEVFMALFEKYTKSVTPENALRHIYRDIYGTASVAILSTEYNAVFLGTNNGSLYAYHDEVLKITVFASELRILKKACVGFFDSIETKIQHFKPGTIATISYSDAVLNIRSLNDTTTLTTKKRDVPQRVNDLSSYTSPLPTTPHVPHDTIQNAEKIYSTRHECIKKLKRCTKCILPETFPFIQFNEGGVCNYCTFYTPITFPDQGGEKLKKIVAQQRTSTRTQADLIMGFSGGRDSCYGLHYLKKELGITPIAYTYDWGMITDLGRRNQARLCAKLGIEHVIVSADLAKKRSYIRKNVLAWIRRPDLGLIPLFMAGDKQYFYHANKLAQDTGIQTILLCENPYERTHFKQGFCGITHNDNTIPPYMSNPYDKIKIALYYGTQFLKNPAYINTSLADTFSAYLSYYLIPHEYLYLFEYTPWNEHDVDEVLLSEYDWELSPDTETTWRIGDGTAPFYNYIYYMVTGFTENDTLRSNQIRQNMMTRDTALACVEKENLPRWESLSWYLRTIDVPLEDSLTAIHSMKPLWEK